MTVVQCARVERIVPGRAFVRLETGEACAACVSHGSCRPISRRLMDRLVEVSDPIGVRQGDRVEIRFPEGSLWIGVLLALAIPGAAMVAGAAAGWSLAPGLGWSATAAAATGGFSALAVAFGAGLLVHRAKVRSDRYLPKITRTLTTRPHGTLPMARESDI
ncbi:MAG: SoxR reducing system RseC family protein [Desulfosoma sp.]